MSVWNFWETRCWRSCQVSISILQFTRNWPEGELTKLRASLVCEPTLAFCTRQLCVWGIISCWDKGEEHDGRTGAEVRAFGRA